MAKAKRGMKMRLGPGWTLSARAKNSQQLFVQTSTSAKARCLRSLPCGSTKRSPRRTGPGPVVGEMLCGHAVQDYISILTRPIEEPFAAPGNRQPCPDCSSLSITLKQNGNGGRPVENWYAALDVLSRLGTQVNIVTSLVGGMSQQRWSVYRADLQRNYIGLGGFQDTSMYWFCRLVHGRIS